MYKFKVELIEESRSEVIRQLGNIAQALEDSVVTSVSAEWNGFSSSYYKWEIEHQGKKGIEVASSTSIIIKSLLNTGFIPEGNTAREQAEKFLQNH